MAMNKNAIRYFCIFLGLAAVVGCSSMYSSFREVTYPPDFKYIDSEKLQSSMSEMAIQISILDGALQHSVAAQGENGDAIREEVVGALSEIYRIGSELQASSGGANHPFMEDHMRDFISSVDIARSAASLEEPRYYFAGKVAGACASCHKINR